MASSKLDIIEALDVQVFPQYPRRIVISWEIGKKLPFPVAFNIFRSGGDNGEFEKLNAKPVTGFFYFDDGLKPLSKIFEVIYQLEVIFPFSDETGERKTQRTGNIPLVCSPRLKRSYLVAKRMDQKHFIEYRARSGVDLVVFKRKHFGEECTECYNPLTESSTKANCEECFGTGFIDGFWDPIETIGKIDPPVKIQQFGQVQFEEPINTQAHLRAFPQVKKGDVVVEVCWNNRWYVNNVQTVEHGRYPVKQLAEIKMIPRDSALYELELPEDVL